MIFYTQEESIDLVEKQRAVADELIEKLGILDPTCVIAGGCVRDWLYNQKGKDIDIFMHDGGYSQGENLRRINKILGTDLKALSKDYTGSVTDNHISGVFEGPYHGEIINVILWKKRTYNVTNTFPAYNVKMHYFPHYGTDKMRWVESIVGLAQFYCNEIYVTPQITNKYWKKLKSKFPDKKIIIANIKCNNITERDILKGIDMVEDIGSPTEAELATIAMLHPEFDLRKPWFDGEDITDKEPS